MTEFKNVGDHVEDLADGRMLAPGETAELDEEAVGDPRNQDLITRGVFISIDEQTEGRSTRARATREGSNDGGEG